MAALIVAAILLIPSTSAVLRGPVCDERNTHYADDQTRDDDVLERHHAIIVRAQTLQRFGSLDVILQHMRNFLARCE